MRRPTYKIPVGVGDIKLGERERLYLNHVIASNRLSYGPFSEKFESQFAKLHDCQYAVFCNSGTSALHISLAALKEKYQWRDGDEIIVPATTFVATSNVVLHNNLTPVFVDVDAKTYNIDPYLIEGSVGERTRGIIPVHLMGLPCDMDPICDIAEKYNLRIIEDSCETMFAGYKGRKVGSMGDIGCFSTYVAHYIVTGVGGLATTNDRELAVLTKSVMNHGRDSIYLNIDDDEGVEKEQLCQIVAKRFSFVHVGYSFRATELEAAIGLAQLDEKDKIIERRKANASFYMDALKDLGEYIQLPYIPRDRDHMFMLFPMVLKHGKREDLLNYLEENMIETRELMPLLNQPIYRKIFGDIEGQYPVAKWLNRCGFYIGCHQYLTLEQREYVVEKFHEYFQNRV